MTDLPFNLPVEIDGEEHSFYALASLVFDEVTQRYELNRIEEASKSLLCECGSKHVTLWLEAPYPPELIRAVEEALRESDVQEVARAVESDNLRDWWSGS